MSVVRCSLDRTRDDILFPRDEYLQYSIKMETCSKYISFAVFLSEGRNVDFLFLVSEPKDYKGKIACGRRAEMWGREKRFFYGIRGFLFVTKIIDVKLDAP